MVQAAAAPLPTTLQRVTALAELEQPPEAIASLCKAVFGTSSDQATLAQLFDLAAAAAEPREGAVGAAAPSLPSRNVAASAACVLLQHGSHTEAVLRQFVGSVFLPLAVDQQGSPHGRHQLQQCADLLTGRQAWQLVLEVLACAHASLRAAAGLGEPACGSRATPHDTASLAPSHASSSTGTIDLQLPAAVASDTIALLVSTASSAAAAAADDEQQASAGGVQSVLSEASGPLFATTCQLLRCSEASLRQAAFQQLLPALLQAAGAQQPQPQRPRCLQQLLGQCLDMLEQPVVPRRMGLAVLLQFSGEWAIQPPSPEGGGAGAGGDSSARFWALLRECLVDPEPLNRKRALRLLQLLLPPGAQASQPLWGVLVALYELLDEFTPHLVKACWSLVSQLQPLAPEFGDEDADADVPVSSGEINVLGRGVQQQQQQQQQRPEGQGAAPAADGARLGFCWVSIIWTRALTHDNMQVQRMALRTLLKREWPPTLLQQVPPAFFTQAVLPSLRSAVHHKPPSAAALTGAAAAAQARHVSSSVDVAGLAGRLMARYVAVARPADVRQLFDGGLQAASAEGQEVATVGLLAVLRALAAAAGEVVASGTQLLADLPDADAAAYVEASLVQLRRLMQRLAARHGSKSAAASNTHLLTIMQAVAPAGSASLAAYARALLDVPDWLLAPGAPVHAAARQWLLGSGAGDSSSSSTWISAGLMAMWQDYFSSGTFGVSSSSSNANGLQQQQQQAHATAPDYARWRTASTAWLRLVLSCGDHVLQEEVAAAASDLAARVEQLSSRSYLAPGLPDRALIMLQQLLAAAETAFRVRTAKQGHNGGGDACPFLEQQALRMAVLTSSHLGRLLQDYSRCFYMSPTELCSRPGSSHAMPALGLPPAAWEAAARAEAAAQAAASVAELLSRHAAADKAARQSLLQLLQQLTETGQLLASRPLPSAAATETQGTAALLTAAALATATEQSRAAAVLVLRHITVGLSRVTSLAPPLVIASLSALQPAALLSALLREADAAAAATAAWQPRLAGLNAAGDPLQGWVEGLDWAAVDAVLSLTAALSRPVPETAAAAAANGHSSSHHHQQQQQQLEEQERLPTGALPPGVVVAVFAQGLDALQWSPADALLHPLRCVRRAWSLIVRSDSALQDAAVQGLAASGLELDEGQASSSSSSSSSTHPLVQLAAALGRRLLDILHTNKQRQPLLCSSIVRCLLLPELMLADSAAQPQLAALHDGPGAPLRRFVAGVLAHSKQGSPVLHLVVALRLAACVPLAPRLLVSYREELLQLLLFGMAPDNAPDPPASLDREAATEWQLMAQPLDPEQQTALYLTGIAPRAALLIALEQLATAAGSSSPEYTAAAEDAGIAFWGHLMHTALNDPVLSGMTPKIGSEAHRLKVRLWQGLAGAAAFLVHERQRQAATTAMADVLRALEACNAASVKQYQEHIGALLLLRHPGLDELVMPLLLDVEKGTAATPSHILIAVLTGLHAPPDRQARVLPPLARALLPWTCHHTHSIRVFAQLGLCAMLEAHPLDAWPGWEQGLGAGGTSMLAALQGFLTGNAEFARCRRSMGEGMRAWSPDAATSPAGILTANLLQAGAEAGEDGAPPVTFEGAPASLMDQVVHFLAVERGKLREAALDKLAAEAAAGIVSAATAASVAAAAGAPPGASDYQRKVTPSERAELLADVLDGSAASGGGGGGGLVGGTRRHDLIVVASLIHKLPNLAGLARTAEVLGAGTLALSDRRVTKEAQFTSISVTAERWVPVIEVPEATLVSWLLQQKANGYALVGLEQTAESHPLPGFPFPPKTVLVLGREKEGIPPEVIALLDATVEIPQAGIIRSLNVHVSGALAMYEYCTRQAKQGGAGAASLAPC